MERSVKMKQIFIFSFLFLYSIFIVSSYSAGEELNLSYSNITNVTYPCLLINQSVYLSGNISIGNNSCIITYFDNVTEQITIDDDDDNGGGGGGSSSSSSGKRACTAKWKCTSWGNCKPGNKAIRKCTNTNNCYKNKPKEERYCYYPVATAELTEPLEEVNAIEQPQEEQETTEPPIEEETKRKGISLWWWIAIVVFLLMVIGWFVFVGFKREDNEY